MPVTALLRAGLPFVGAGHRSTTSPPQVSKKDKKRSAKAKASAAPASSVSDREQAAPASEAVSQNLSGVLADLDAQLTQATTQLDAAQTADVRESGGAGTPPQADSSLTVPVASRATIQAIQAELTAVQSSQKAPPAVKEANGDWQKTIRLAEQILTLKALTAEREAEVADLQRQLAEFEEAEEAPAAVPALVPAGGLADTVDEEGRERVAVLERQLQGSLESQFAQRSSGMGERLPHKPSRVMTKKPSLDSLLRSAKFPGLVVLTTAAGVGDVCKAAVSLFKRFT